MSHTFIAGADIGATNLRVAVATREGDVEARRALPLPKGAPEDVLRAVARTVDELARGIWVGATASAVGVVLPGAVDPGRGVVASAANMPGWDDVPVAALLRGEREIAVAVENDANAAALGEGWKGAAAGLDDYVFIALGTGIGAGVVLDGRVRRGAHHLAGEVAFFRMSPEQVRAGGWQECLEGVVGGRAAAAKAVELFGADAKPSQLFDAAASGDVRARAWLTGVQEHLAMAICDIVALLDPQAVVLGGGVAHAQGEPFVGPIRDLVHRCVPAPTPVLLASLGEDAQLVGALRLAAEALEGRR